MDTNFQLVPYLIQRSLESPYTVEASDLFSHTTASERALFRDKMFELQLRYQRSHPTLFQFERDDPDYDSRFQEDMRTITAGVWRGLFRVGLPVPEYCLQIAKREAQTEVEKLKAACSESQIASYQIHIDAINDLLTTNKEPSPVQDADDFSLASYLVQRALQTGDYRDAMLIFENTIEEETQLIRHNLRALQEAFMEKHPTLFSFPIDHEDYDYLFQKDLKQISKVCDPLPLAPHDPRFYLAIAKRNAQSRLDCCQVPESKRQSYQVQVDSINNLFPSGKRQKTSLVKQD